MDPLNIDTTVGGERKVLLNEKYLTYLLLADANLMDTVECV